MCVVWLWGAAAVTASRAMRSWHAGSAVDLVAHLTAGWSGLEIERCRVVTVQLCRVKAEKMCM